MKPAPRTFFTNPAQLTIVMTFAVTWLVGALLRSPLLFLMSSTCIAIATMAWLVRRAGLNAVRCEFVAPARVTEGEEVTCCLRLLHTGRFPLFSLRAELALGEWVQWIPAGAQGSIPPFTTSEQPAEQAIAFIGVMMPGERLEMRGRLKFDLRGRRRVGAVTLRCADPLDLWQVRARQETGVEVLALPRRIPLAEAGRALAAPAARRTARCAAVLAEGGEFRGTRDYVPGDPLRRIHWKWTARLNEFRVMEFEDETAGSLAIALDLDRTAHAGAGRESTVEYAVRIVASLAEHFALRGQNVTALIPQGDEVSTYAVRGRRGLSELLEALATASADSPLDVATLYQHISRSTAGIPLVIVSPASLARLETLKSHDRRAGSAVTVLAIDAESFAPRDLTTGFEPVARGAQSSRTLPRSLFTVRRGDDLRRLLESAL